MAFGNAIGTTPFAFRLFTITIIGGPIYCEHFLICERPIPLNVISIVNVLHVRDAYTHYIHTLMRFIYFASSLLKYLQI